MRDLDELAGEAVVLGAERDVYLEAKKRKAQAEDQMLEAIVHAVKPALPAISSKIGIFRGVELGGGLWIRVDGYFFDEINRALTTGEVCNRTSPGAVLAVLVAAVRAQKGKLEPRTADIQRETAILEGIAQAFKIGSVR